MLTACFLWSGMNVVYAFVQDRYIFPALFDDYEGYRNKTPFLIPSPASIKRCIASFRGIL